MDSIGTALIAFRAALAAAASCRAMLHGMGLYEMAMAAGRPGLGGFAPVLGAAVRRRRQGLPVVAAEDEVDLAPPPGGSPGRNGLAPRGVAARDQSGFAPAMGGVARQEVVRNMVAEDVTGSAPAANAGAAPVDHALVAARAGDVEPSYRAVAARARAEAAAGQARRAAERAALHLPATSAAGWAECSFAPPGAAAMEGITWHAGRHGLVTLPDMRMGTERGLVTQGAPFASQPTLERHHAGISAEPADSASPNAAAPVERFDIERQLEDYFFRKSRLPPAGGAGFNPLLSPAWAGLKIPG